MAVNTQMAEAGVGGGVGESGAVLSEGGYLLARAGMPAIAGSAWTRMWSMNSAGDARLERVDIRY